MRKHEILKNVDFGSDVAESDSHLRTYFVETNIFNEVIHDETDLILGPKGSGKTAIFRMLSDPSFEKAPLKDTLIVPAFNTQGEVLFHQLSETPLNEDLLRKVWMAYLLSLIGREIVEGCQLSSYHSEIKARLTDLDLWEPEAGVRRIWTRIASSISKVYAKVTGPGIPVAEGGLEFRSTTERNGDAPAWMSHKFHPESLIRLFIEALEGDQRRCWVIFDRLDESFTDPTLERAALRALLRTQADISSYSSTVRVKLFLRSDIFSRITREEGFVNLTHFRVLKISWTRRQVADLIVKRLADSREFLHVMHERGVTDQMSALRSFFSTVTEGRGSNTRATDPIAYILEKTVDAHSEFNPRNVVSFVRAALRYEITNSRRSDRDMPVNEPVITQEAMVRAWHRVSEQRVTDTLFAEHNSMRAAIERLRNGPQRFDREYLATVLELGEDQGALKVAISNLEDCGFMSLAGKTTYKVPDLYRPYLGLNPKWQDRGERQAAEREAWRRSRSRAGGAGK